MIITTPITGLSGQVYREAKRLDFPPDAAIDVSKCAARDYGDHACKTDAELISVFNEVFRVD